MSHSKHVTAPPFGVYTPLVTFFHEDESIDIESTKAHIRRMADGGVTGLVLQGSNGEAPHLGHDERSLLIRTARTYLDELGYSHVTLIVGCGAASVRETLSYLEEAREAGGDFGLVLPPAYWSAAMSPAVLETFFNEVASKTTLSFLVYNFPGVTSGIDISSDLIIRLARENPGKIVGVKLTCGNVGKLQRVATTLPGEQFAALGGKSDFFLPALVAGSTGIIAALANVVPKTHVTLLRLYQEGDLDKAKDLQSKLSHADWALSKLGVGGVKAVVAHFFGYGSGRARLPLVSPEAASMAGVIKGAIQEVVDYEKEVALV